MSASFHCDFCKSDIAFDFTGLRAHLIRYHKIDIEDKQALLSFIFSIILVQYDEDEKLTRLLQSLIDKTNIILKNLRTVDDDIEIIGAKKHDTSRKALEKTLLEVLDTDSDDEEEDIEVVGQDQDEVQITEIETSDHEDEIEEVVSKAKPCDVINVDPEAEETVLQNNQDEQFVSLEETVEAPELRVEEGDNEFVAVVEENNSEKESESEIEKEADRSNFKPTEDVINSVAIEELLQEDHDGPFVVREESDRVTMTEDTEDLSDIVSVEPHVPGDRDGGDNQEIMGANKKDAMGNEDAGAKGNRNREESAETDIVKQEQLRQEINLVHRFLNLDLCRLCWETVPTESKNHHEKEVHEKDKRELEMEYFTLNDLAFSCEICVSKFLSLNLLDAHKLKVHKLKRKETEELKCDLCFTAFKKNDVYKKHMDMNHKIERKMLEDGKLDPGCLSFPCQDCDQTFLTDSLVDCHKILTHYAKKTKMPCSECGKSMLKRSIRKHKEIIHKEGGRSTNEKHNDLPMNENMNVEPEPEESVIIREYDANTTVANAEVTNEAFVKGRERLENTTQCQKDSGVNKCSLCYQTFEKNSHLRKHFYRYHHHLRQYLNIKVSPQKLISHCSLCDLKFLNDDLLDEHTKQHYLSDNGKNKSNVNGSKTSNDKHPTICKLCLLDYKTEENLMNHKNSVHSSELEAFKKNIKKNDLIYKCGQCPKRYFTRISLDFHVSRKHSLNIGKRPRDADNNASRGRSQLPRLNVSSLHKGQSHKKQNKCFLCGKSLISERDLIDHCIDEHSGRSNSDESDNSSGLSKSTNQTIENFFGFLDSFGGNS